MKKNFSFQHKVSKKTVRDLKIVTVFDTVEVRGQATRGCAINPITERSEFWYSVDIDEVIWHFTNVYPFMEMVADEALAELQEAAEQYARTIFSQPAVKPCIDPQDEAGKAADERFRKWEESNSRIVNRYLYD